jgi:formate dehydrogenase major subunit
MTRRASTLDAIEPEAMVTMAPSEIHRLGLTAGQTVRVSTRRGAIELMLRADPDVAKGLIFIPFCYNEAAANLLTNPALDPYGKIPEFKFCAARIEAAARAKAAAE